jgi:hypothetical protein
MKAAVLRVYLSRSKSAFEGARMSTNSRTLAPACLDEQVQTCEFDNATAEVFQCSGDICKSRCKWVSRPPGLRGWAHTKDDNYFREVHLEES